MFSCSPGSKIEKTGAVDAVKRYNSMMIRAYMEANINIMTGVVTEKHMKMLYPTIQALRATGNIMMAEQKTFIVKKVSVEENKATLRSEETWVYWWQDSATNAITKPQETITYKIQYNLIKNDGSWRVDSLVDIE
jgi:hypothetical protein